MFATSLAGTVQRNFTDRVRAVNAKFHYTDMDRTGPDPTRQSLRTRQRSAWTQRTLSETRTDRTVSPTKSSRARLVETGH